MTNMQHYMDDIHDLLDGLNDEMNKRLERLAKWDRQIAKHTDEVRKLEEFIFDVSIPLESRTEKLSRLAELKGQLRVLAERKVELAERNQITVQAVYSKMSELAYHCKCEVEIDNPGCTEQREKQFYHSIVDPSRETSGRQDSRCSSALPSSKRTREMSFMTDDDRHSTRSGTPLGKEMTKKKVGRPRINASRGKNQSAFSSTRSSVEHDTGNYPKKMSKYMRKKQEKLRLQEEERTKVPLEMKKNIVEDFGEYGLEQWGQVGEKLDVVVEDDDQDLLDFLIPGFELEGLPSPPKGMMEALDVTEADLCGMEMYPAGHKTIDSLDFTNNMSDSNNYQSTGTPTTYSIFSKGNNNAASSSSSGELAERRKRNMLFGSIAETSFSGRPRKLTDRVTEMIQFNREKESRQKTKRDAEEWCFCGGVNTNSDMMVQCENKECRIEWFHFDCVGLVMSPKDEWYCLDCRSTMGKDDNTGFIDN